MRNSQDLTREGVVTFIDVLGWKGIYQRQPDPLGTLQRFVGILGKRLAYWQEARQIRRATTVRTISDTIALFAHASPEDATQVMDLHGRVCGDVIPLSIQLGIPVRGALSFGEFEERENMFVGKAVDEAAGWYERADWIGVHMTPSAALLYPCLLGEEKDAVWRLYTPPFSGCATWETQCVNWPRLARQEDSYGPYDYREMTDDFRQLGPIVPEITGKFTNSLKFWDKMMDSHHGRSEANMRVHAVLNQDRKAGRSGAGR